MKKRVFLILLLTFALMFGILTSASASGSQSLFFCKIKIPSIPPWS